MNKTTPYAIGATTTFWDDERKAKFKVTIKSATKVTIIYVRKDSSVINTYRTTTEMIQPGTYDWGWSGFGDDLVFNTEVLKQGRLTADVLTDAGASTSLELSAKQVYADWLDLKIDDRAKRIDVTVYVAFSGAPVADKALDAATFARVKGLILEGIGRYWSRRQVFVAFRYDVVVTAKERAANAIGFLLTKPTPLKNIPALPGGVRRRLSDSHAGERCFNPGVPAGSDALPILFYYNDASPPSDDRIRETGAHEFGHAVLLRGFDSQTSFTHKGTSTTWSQEVIEGAYTYPPAPGEIDLMKYSNDPDPPDYFTRLIAAEDDVKALLSLARIELSAR